MENDDLSKMNEQELREYKDKWPDSIEELNTIINSLVERKHDYGTCVYAMSISAVAAFNYVARKLGVTGFQASCADLNILCRTRNFDFGSLQDYSKLLYPQYCNEDHFPTWLTIVEKHKDYFKKEAQKKIDEGETAHEDVLSHWKVLASL